MPPLVIAHRGASGTRPENTLAAFRRAAAVGAAMVELDVQLTRDDAVVVIHDDTLDRTTDGTGPVGAHTLDELRALDAGAWFGPAFAGERIPTLAEVLAAVPLAVNVELKAPGGAGLEARTLAVVESAAALGRTVFSSFDPGSLERLRALSPEAVLAVLWDGGPEGGALLMALQRAKRVGARSLHLRKDAKVDAILPAAAAAGIGIRVWTVNERAEWDRLAAAGVEGIFTDHPERFLHIQPAA